jgi:hypothetical protein
MSLSWKAFVLFAIVAAIQPTFAVDDFFAADDCQPWTWNTKRDIVPDQVVIPGQIVCRYTTFSGEEVNYYTCTEIANKYSILVEKFFKLNPDLDKDCKTIEPNTEYCVAGCEFPLLLCIFLHFNTC